MSRFVSATADSTSPSQQHQAEEEDEEQDAKWRAAHAAIEATRTQPRLEPGSQEGGKSLFETLQANKEKKQALYEESLRLTTQFQSLDEDDVEFLDSVLEATRAREDAVKRETKAQLEAFKLQQLELERGGAAGSSSSNAATATATATLGPVEEPPTWTVNRKRKRDHNKLAPLGGVKLRKTSSAEKNNGPATSRPAEEVAPGATTASSRETTSPLPPTNENTAAINISEQAEKILASPPPAPAKPSPALGGLGLGGYSSSDDD